MYPYACLDLNGDGIPDILAYGNDGLTVILGLPNLQFAKPTHYPVPQATGTYSLVQYVLLDMNGDGHPDFVAAGPGGVYIAYGRADGSFVSGDVYESGTTVGPSAAIADFNEDGTLDLVTADFAHLQLNLGKPDGTFEPAAPILSSNLSSIDDQISAPVLHGDFNGDGHQDLLTMNTEEDPSFHPVLLLGHGDGTFQPQTVVSAITLQGYVSTFVADLNHDGKDDIAVLSDTSLTAYLAKGDGTFRPVTTPLTTVPGEYTSNTLTFADVNGDGLPDLLYTTDDHLAIMLGHGDGTFTSAVLYSIPPIAAASGRIRGAVALGDFDGDGAQDVAVLVPYSRIGVYPDITNAPTQLFVFYRQGAANVLDASTFLPAVAGPVSYRSYDTLLAADLNGDGRADLLASNAGQFTATGNVLGVFPGLFNRTLGPEQNFVGGLYIDQVSAADLNHDGLPDLVVLNGISTQANAFTVLLNQPAVPTLTGILTATPDPVVAGQSFTLTAALQTSTGPATLTGTITFAIDGTSIGTVPVRNNLANLIAPTTLAPGTHQLTAITSSISDGTNTYAPITLRSTELVTAPKIATTLTANVAPNPSTYGQPVLYTAHVQPAVATAAVPTGQVTLTFCHGATITRTLDSSGNFTVVYPFAGALAEPVGSCSFTASYPGNVNFIPSTSAPVPYTVLPAPSTTTLSASPSPAYASIPIHLLASIQGVPSPTLDPTTGQMLPPANMQDAGQVTFREGSATLGVAMVNNGAALLDLSALSPGTHVLTATYTGDANLLGSSGMLSLHVLPSVFAIALSPPALSMHAGSGTAGQVMLSSIDGYRGTLALSLGPLPPHLTASFSSPTLALTAGKVSPSTLTFTANPQLASIPASQGRGAPWPIALALVGVMPLWLRRRSAPRLLLAALAALLLIGAGGCTNIGSPYYVITPGTYVVPVTATDTTTHQTKTANLTLTITP